MRPINLIPPDQRRGQHAPSRTGRLAPYLVVGILLAALGGVTALVLSGNQISERKAEVAELEDKQAELSAKAQQLASYSQFRAARDLRMGTVASLAESRFDWERTLQELALILPSDVWLVNVTGSASAGVEPPEGAAITTRDSVPGPALELIGCAPGQEAVAGFVAALQDIDGVTRVGVHNSKLPDLDATNSATASGGDDDCRTRDFIARFEIVVAFDEVPLPGTVVPAPETGAPDATPTGAEEELGDAYGEKAAAQSSAEIQTEKARNAVETLTP